MSVDGSGVVCVAGACELECSFSRSVHARVCAERWGSVKSLHACRREGGVMKFIVACVRVGRGADATQRGTRPHGMSTPCAIAACHIGA